MCVCVCLRALTCVSVGVLSVQYYVHKDAQTSKFNGQAHRASRMSKQNEQAKRGSIMSEQSEQTKSASKTTKNNEQPYLMIFILSPVILHPQKTPQNRLTICWRFGESFGQRPPQFSRHLHRQHHRQRLLVDRRFQSHRKSDSDSRRKSSFMWRHFNRRRRRKGDSWNRLG